MKSRIIPQTYEGFIYAKGGISNEWAQDVFLSDAKEDACLLEKTINLDPYFTWYIKENFKWIKDHNPRGEKGNCTKKT